MLFTQEHEELRRTVRNFIEKEVNPFVPEWEAAGRFPIHDVFKKMGDLGLLGVTKPEEYGGMGLDYSYGLIVAEEIGGATCGGVPLSIGVQTDMATPALARFGSDELKRDYLAPAIAGDMVASIAVSEPHAGSDVGALTSKAEPADDGTQRLGRLAICSAKYAQPGWTLTRLTANGWPWRSGRSRGASSGSRKRAKTQLLSEQHLRPGPTNWTWPSTRRVPRQRIESAATRSVRRRCAEIAPSPRPPQWNARSRCSTRELMRRTSRLPGKNHDHHRRRRRQLRRRRQTQRTTARASQKLSRTRRTRTKH